MKFFLFSRDKSAFTLVEILVGILIFSFIVIGAFQALTSVSFGKAKLVHNTNTQKQILYFSERLFEEIKKGGVIDYEEYFNRQVVGTTFLSGHYDTPTGFGNFGRNGVVGTSTYGEEFYYCVSGDGLSDKMTGTGCVDAFNSTLNDYNGAPQRYGQYSFQFIDYNSNFDDDNGDEDGNGNLLGDDDDEYLGRGPAAFSGGIDVKELYLISGDMTKRTLFRWNVRRDPNAPSGEVCSIDASNVITGDACLGTLEFLKLEGRDWGMDHTISTDDFGEYDGVLDTWLIDGEFSSSADVVAGSDTGDYWVPLFPDTINVSEFQVFVYPNKDGDLAWKEADDTINIAPYVRIQLSVLPSWKSRRKIKNPPGEIRFSTTIALSDVLSK